MFIYGFKGIHAKLINAKCVPTLTFLMNYASEAVVHTEQMYKKYIQIRFHPAHGEKKDKLEILYKNKCSFRRNCLTMVLTAFNTDYRLYISNLFLHCISVLTTLSDHYNSRNIEKFYFISSLDHNLNLDLSLFVTTFLSIERRLVVQIYKTIHHILISSCFF